MCHLTLKTRQMARMKLRMENMPNDSSSIVSEPKLIANTSTCICYRNRMRVYNPECEVHNPKPMKSPNRRAGKRAWKNYFKNK